MPIFPELQSSLDAAQASGILGEMLFLVQQKHPGQPDKPYVEGSLGNMMQDAIRHLRANYGLREPFSLHGLRKAGVCRLILMDLSVHQIMAITGHRTAKEIDRYGRDYMRSLASEEGYQRYVAWRGRNKRFLDAEGGLFREPALP